MLRWCQQLCQAPLLCHLVQAPLALLFWRSLRRAPPPSPHQHPFQMSWQLRLRPRTAEVVQREELDGQEAVVATGVSASSPLRWRQFWLSVVVARPCLVAVRDQHSRLLDLCASPRARQTRQQLLSRSVAHARPCLATAANPGEHHNASTAATPGIDCVRTCVLSMLRPLTLRACPAARSACRQVSNSSRRAVAMPAAATEVTGYESLCDTLRELSALQGTSVTSATPNMITPPVADLGAMTAAHAFDQTDGGL